MMSVSGAIVALMSVSLVSDWIERHSVTLDPLCVVPDFHLVQWGRWSNGYRPWFLAIKLPSWDWRMDIQTLEHRMHQRCLYLEQGRPWRVCYL